VLIPEGLLRRTLRKGESKNRVILWGRINVHYKKVCFFRKGLLVARSNITHDFDHWNIELL